MSPADTRLLPLHALFPAKARRALLDALFGAEESEASMSELARRAGLTPRAVAVEVRRLEGAGLVEVRSVGSAHVVRPNRRSATTHALAAVFKAARRAPTTPEEVPGVRASLAAHGAPLQNQRPSADYSLWETVVRGLEAARTDATVLRVLPVVLAKHADEMDWTALKECARKRNVKAELGMLLDLTGDAAGLPRLNEEAKSLMDRRRSKWRYLPGTTGTFERQLAEKRTPAAAARWRFHVNMSEQSVRDVLGKHGAIP